jgi:hypothetical protein
VIFAAFALAGGALVVLSLAVLVFAQVVRAKDRQAARERDLLISQIMHLTGKTWTPPPSPEPNGAREPEAVRFIHPHAWPEE